MTISTSSSTPTGTFPITVTGTPLSQTTIFNLTVKSAGCPAKVALENAPDRGTMMGVLYGMRDRVLAGTPTGRRYVDLFYKHARKAWLMLRPGPRARLALLGGSCGPRAALARSSAALAPADLVSIDSLLGAFARDARPALRADIQALQQVLRSGELLKDLVIMIGERSPIP
jgi:hypothetical protein